MSSLLSCCNFRYRSEFLSVFFVLFTRGRCLEPLQSLLLRCMEVRRQWTVRYFVSSHLRPRTESVSCRCHTGLCPRHHRRTLRIICACTESVATPSKTDRCKASFKSSRPNLPVTSTTFLRLPQITKHLTDAVPLTPELSPRC